MVSEGGVSVAAVQRRVSLLLWAGVGSLEFHYRPMSSLGSVVQISSVVL